MPHSCGKPHALRLRPYNYEEEQAPAVYRPTHDEIERMAYSFWEMRGRNNGSAEEDWHRAERTLCGDPLR